MSQLLAEALGGLLFLTPLLVIVRHKALARRDRIERRDAHRAALRASARARVDDLTIGGKP